MGIWIACRDRHVYRRECSNGYCVKTRLWQGETHRNEPAVASTEEEDFEVDIDKLEFDFKTYGTNKHRLGDIVGSSNENEADESRERDSSYSKANIEQDFLNDAGSIKKS